MIRSETETLDVEPTIIFVTDFGGRPDSGEDTVMAVQHAIHKASQINGPVVLDFTQGIYHFYPEFAMKVTYYITNTASEEENPDVTKTIGIYLKNMKNIRIEGNGSLFIFHGKVTMVVIDECENIEIRNIKADFERPSMSEMTVTDVGVQFIDVRVHPASWYEIEGGELIWVGEGWRFRDGYAQVFDPIKNITWRIPNPMTLSVKVEKLEANQLRLHYENKPVIELGHIIQVRDGIRDQVGVFMHRSKNIAWINVEMHYMHGLGFVGQFSENLTFDNLNLAPRKGSGRTAAAFADFIQVSGCRGRVRIENSHFEGAHDDVINVHGTYLQIVDKSTPNQLKVRFMHPQSYGFDAFFPGDTIDFVKVHSLVVCESNTIQAAERINNREILLTLEHPMSEDIEVGDVIENVTWTPEVEIMNNHFARIPTRGVLVATGRKIVIKDNRFERMCMSGIVIANDAESWYESGKVQDVLISGNQFIECGNEEHPVIYIAPENTSVHTENPVHHNICIEDNFIQTSHAAVLYAKSTRGISFNNNRIQVLQSDNNKTNNAASAIQLLACSEVTISRNLYSRYTY